MKFWTNKCLNVAVMMPACIIVVLVVAEVRDTVNKETVDAFVFSFFFFFFTSFPLYLQNLHLHFLLFFVNFP